MKERERESAREKVREKMRRGECVMDPFVVDLCLLVCESAVPVCVRVDFTTKSEDREVFEKLSFTDKNESSAMVGWGY